MTTKIIFTIIRTDKFSSKFELDSYAVIRLPFDKNDPNAIAVKTALLLNPSLNMKYMSIIKSMQFRVKFNTDIIGPLLLNVESLEEELSREELNIYIQSLDMESLQKFCEEAAL